jgi:hypothetical protein
MSSIPINCHPYISQDIQIQKFDTPYKHVVIDNFFTEEIYNKLCKKFPSLIEKTNKPAGNIGASDNFYDAFIYGLKEEDCSQGYDFFMQEIYKNFISELFDVELNQHVALSVHFHKGSLEKPSRDGWSHADLSICSAINDKNKKIKLTGIDCDYQDDSKNLQPKTSKIVRQIAIIYYLNNKTSLEEKDGGGTGVYESYDLKSFVKEVKPVNNRLFAFEVCPHSYHGFIGAKFDRSAIVHWFHSDPNYLLKRNLDAFKKRKKETGLFFERWKKEELYDLEQSPTFFQYFNTDLNNLLT